MGQDFLNILVIAENRLLCCHLVKALEQLKCCCWFASTAEDVRAVLDRHNFSLVLSTRPITEGSALMLLLCKPKRSVFYSIPVEDGCLWFRAFPELVAGERLSGVRPSEFKRLLTDLIARLNPPQHSTSKSSSTAIVDVAERAARRNRGGQDGRSASQSI